MTGADDAALLSLAEAIRLDPSNMQAYWNRAFIWHRKGEFANSVKELDSILKAEPNNAEVLGRRGLILLELEDAERSIRDIKEAIRIAPADAENYVSLLPWRHSGADGRCGDRSTLAHG